MKASKREELLVKHSYLLVDRAEVEGWSKERLISIQIVRNK